MLHPKPFWAGRFGCAIKNDTTSELILWLWEPKAKSVTPNTSSQRPLDGRTKVMVGALCWFRCEIQIYCCALWWQSQEALWHPQFCVQPWKSSTRVDLLWAKRAKIVGTLLPRVLHCSCCSRLWTRRRRISYRKLDLEPISTCSLVSWNFLSILTAILC